MTLNGFIESQEGREHKAYKDADGYSIGVGHFLTKKELTTGLIALSRGLVDWRGGLSDADIDELLQIDIAAHGEQLRPLVKFPLANIQWAALIDFVFNEGIGHFASSTLLKKINAGVTDEASIRGELNKWDMSQGLVNDGLKRRRELEGDIWTGKLALESLT